jgi:sugar lactone lactonase YvrE
MQRYFVLVVLVFWVVLRAEASDLFTVSTPQIAAGGGTGEGTLSRSVSILPQALAIDAQGRLYIADEQYNRVRRMEADGALYTVVGNGRYELGAEGIAAMESGLYVPASLSFSPDGQLYIVDLGNRRVRVVGGDGAVRTVLDANSAEISRASQPFAPYDVCVGLAGEIYVADRGNNAIWRRDAQGLVTRFAGAGKRGFAGDGGQARDALLADPRGVAVGPDGSVFIADYGNGRVRRVEPNGQIGTWTGNGDTSDWQRRILANNASIRPEDVAVDRNGLVLIVDGLRPRLLRHEADFSLVEVLRLGEGSEVVDVATDAQGNYWVADSGQRKVWKVAGSGSEWIAGDGGLRASGDGGAGTNATLYGPRAMLYDAAGTLYIADTDNHRVRRLRPDGQIERVAGSGQAGFSGDGGLALAARLNEPAGLAFDLVGNLYIADTGNNRVRRVRADDGAIETVAGSGQAGFAGDGGPALSARLNEPAGLAFDLAGNLYIADAGNNRVRRVGLDGRIQTIIGSDTGTLTGNGLALQTKLVRPFDIAFDGDGQLYVSDMGSHRVFRLGADLLLRVVAGSGLQGNATDGGRATDMALNRPAGIEPDGAGGLYIADAGSGRVLHVDPGGTLRVLAQAFEEPMGLAWGHGALAVADRSADRVALLQLSRDVEPAAQRVRVPAGYEGYVVETRAGLPIENLLGLAYSSDRAALYVSHGAGIERVEGDGSRTRYADFSTRRYSALAITEGLLVGTPGELGRNQPLTLLAPGPSYLPLALAFEGVESMAQAEEVYVAMGSGKIARLANSELRDYAQLAAGTLLLAADGQGMVYALHREAKALFALQDLDGDGEASGPLEVVHLTFVDGEAVALSWIDAKLYIGVKSGRIWRLEGRSLELFAEGFAPALLALSAGPESGLYALEGDARGGRLLLLRPSVPKIGIWPEKVDFGRVVLGEEALTEVVLRNDGEVRAQLRIAATDSLALGGAIALEPGQVRRLVLRWVPERGGRTEGEIVFELAANGAEALRVALLADVLAPQLVMVPEVDFGVVAVGQRLLRELVLRNDGQASLHLERVEVDGAYAVAWEGPQVLEPGEERVVEVELAAGDKRAYNSLLRVLSNDPTQAVREVRLVGSGGVAVLSGVPTAIDLGAVVLNKVGRQNVLLKNEGQVDLLVRDIRTGTLRFIVSPRQLIIPPGQSKVLRFDFRPGVHGVLQGELSLLSSDPERPQVVVPFSGRGISAILEVEQEQYAFAAQPLGGEQTLNIVLHNWGTRPIELENVETQNAQFKVLAWPRSLAAGGSIQIPVTYRSTVPGPTRGALVVHTNLAEAPRLEIALSGRAQIDSRFSLLPLEETWVPGEEWSLVLAGEKLYDVRGLIVQLHLPGPWVELADVDFVGSVLAAGEPLVVKERRGDVLELGISLTGDALTYSGAGELATLRFRSRRAQTAVVALSQVVVRNGLGLGDTLAVEAETRVPVAGDFDGNGALDLRDFFALVDQIGAGEMRFDLDGNGNVGIADVRLLLVWLGPAGKAVVNWQDVGVQAAWPNPFNAEVTLAFVAPDNSPYALEVYDALGRKVRVLDAGLGDAAMHQLVWDGRDESGRSAASGVYFARLNWAGGQRVLRLLLLR